MTDEIFEQDDELAAVKRWWNDNYKAVLAGVAIALLIMGAWYGWPAYRDMQVQSAAELYNLEFKPAVEANETATVLDLGQRLIDEHEGTVYASLAALRMAKVYYTDEQNPEQAAVQLRWVVDAGDAEYQATARVRLANLMVDQNKAAEALALLSGDPAEGVEALWYERVGDAQAAQGDVDAAKAAYERALIYTTTPPKEEWIKTKLYNLGNAAAAAPVNEVPDETSSETSSEAPAEQAPAANDEGSDVPAADNSGDEPAAAEAGSENTAADGAEASEATPAESDAEAAPVDAAAASDDSAATAAE